jgi:hypothetical protein
MTTNEKQSEVDTPKTISKSLLINFLLNAPEDIDIEQLLKFIEAKSRSN